MSQWTKFVQDLLHRKFVIPSHPACPVALIEDRDRVDLRGISRVY